MRRIKTYKWRDPEWSFVPVSKRDLRLMLAVVRAVSDTRNNRDTDRALARIRNTYYAFNAPEKRK